MARRLRRRARADARTVSDTCVRLLELALNQVEKKEGDE